MRRSRPGAATAPISKVAALDVIHLDTSVGSDKRSGMSQGTLGRRTTDKPSGSGDLDLLLEETVNAGDSARPGAVAALEEHARIGTGRAWQELVGVPVGPAIELL